MFVIDLWQSVFTPGTTPALMKATHASFILLILSLISLIFLSKSIHFVNLLVIAILLYASVIWFVGELAQAKLKTNEELKAEADKKDAEDAKTTSVKGEVSSATTTTAVPATATPRKRKV